MAYLGNFTADGALRCDTTIGSISLPAGAATEAKQLPDNHQVTVSNASIPVTGTFFQATQPISAAALPLPTGAATAAGQLPDNHQVNVSNASLAITAASLPLPAGAATAVNQLPDGHAVRVENSQTAFGAMNTESLTPVFQVDAVYGIISRQVRVTESGVGTVTANDSSFVCATNSGIGAFATIQSNRRFRYRPGQGMLTRFSCKYGTPVASTFVVAGVGHAEDGVYFAYSGTLFGILYVNRGIRQVERLTITTGATSAGNVLINGVAVPVTNSSNVQRTAFEIRNAGLSGFQLDVATTGGNTYVDYISGSAGPVSSLTFDANGTGAVAAVTTERTGVASTDTFIPQANWNLDVLDGTGPSGVTLDQTRFNVYEIQLQYLGAGDLRFGVEVAVTDKVSKFVYCHVIKYANNNLATSFSTPTFPFTSAAYDFGTGAAASVEIGSFGSYLEGKKAVTGNRFCDFNTITGVGGTFTPLLTVQNTVYFKGKANQVVFQLTSITVSADHTRECVIICFRSKPDFSLALVGNPLFVPYSLNNSPLYVDKSATGVTFDNDQILWVGSCGPNGQTRQDFVTDLYDISLEPGESLCLAARSVGGSATSITASLVGIEDI